MDIEWGRSADTLQRCVAKGDVNSDDVGKALEGLYTTLRAVRASTNASGASTAMQSLVPVPLDILFACLGSDSERIVEVACEVSHLLTQLLPFESVVLQYKDYATAGLQHPLEAVRALALNVFDKGMDNDENALDLLVQSGLFTVVLHSLADESTIVASQAANLIIKACNRANGLVALLQPEHVNLLLSLKERSSIVQFRVISLCVRLAQQSAVAATQIENTHGLLLTAADFDLSDVLSFLNAVELASQLASAPGGFKLLKQERITPILIGVLAFISSGQLPGRADDAELVMAAPFVGPALVGFFGKLSIADLQVLEYDAPVLSFLTVLLQADSQPFVQEAAVTAIGLIGSSPTGLSMLRTYNPPPWNVLLYVYTHRGLQSSDIRSACQTALTLILTNAADPQLADALFIDMCNIYKSVASTWPTYSSSGVRAATRPDYTVAIISDVNDETRWTAYGLINALAQKSWGRRRMLQVPELMSHLLNRETESEKTGIEWKFTVIQQLKGLRSDPVLGPDFETSVKFYLPRVEQYISEGPFRRGATSQVTGMVL